MEAVAARMAGRAPQTAVRCAYLELTAPDLSTAAADLARSGAHAVTVVPMFLGIGKHVRDDLPALMERLRAQFPAVVFTLQQAVGEDARLLDLLARIALGLSDGRQPGSSD
ncbi:MAG: hypothetical protein JWQ33_2143 [Ramlibacter sp.]|nr:hypothetical protein [Ramlibacter sp.]